MTIQNLDEMLQKAFDESSKIYQSRGFQRRIGFGRKPALVSIDLANAWTRPGNPFTCDMEKMDREIMPGMQRLLEACRKNGHPVVHVTTAYQNTDRNDPHNDMGMWHYKIPVEAVSLEDKHLWAIDDRIAPIKGEWVMMKKRASAFSGTPLAGYLRSCGVDTLIMTGVTATACVRTSICDGIQEGFRTIAVRECIGDRVPGAVAWNLYDIDAKFADVELVDTCVNYLNNVEGFNART
jgi:nicotinamidase-related amidase